MSLEAPSVLGIDAAWTDGQASGMTLVQRQHGRWACLAVAPSYSGFCEGFKWGENCKPGSLNIANVFAKCAALACTTPDVVAVDMPLATVPIVGRRVADDEVSRLFGHRKCATHSPSAQRPGLVGGRFSDALIGRKFQLVTSGLELGRPLLEVYPHPALLGLTGAEERLPYKVSKRAKYWPDEPSEARKRLLVEEWRIILTELGKHIQGVELPLPDHPEKQSIRILKSFEDAIDALVCAWVGIEFLEGRAIALGDATAAIWVPCSSMRLAKN